MLFDAYISSDRAVILEVSYLRPPLLVLSALKLERARKVAVALLFFYGQRKGRKLD